MENFPAGSVIDNKYLRWYLKICASPSSNPYVEQHHIVPRSFGGSNCKKNIVKLSARGHFIAHALLIRCSVGIFKRKAALAAHYMLSGCVKHAREKMGASRTYAAVRSSFAGAQRGRTVSQETRDKLSKAHRGKIVSQEARDKQSASTRRTKSFYALSPQNIEHYGADLRKFCKEHNLSINTVDCFSPGNPIVITAGKNKGWIVSFERQSSSFRDLFMQNTKERRQKAAAEQWKTKPKTSTRNVSVVLRDPVGHEHYFINMLAAEASTGIPWTTMQSCKRIPWTFTRGKGVGWTIISRNKS